MTHWWQWPDSIFSFPGSFCQDSSPTQLHALTYVLLVTYNLYLEQNLDAALKNHYPSYASIQRILNHQNTEACWLVSNDYVNLYSTKWKIPLVVSYKFNNGQGSTMTRPNRFKQDVRLVAHRSMHNDYLNSGYDRGHMATAGTCIVLAFIHSVISL